MINETELKNLFLAFSKLKVLIVGDVMLDEYIYGKVDRISPEAPVPIVAVEKKETRCGGAANVAMNIKSLGATPLLFSIIGDDASGKYLSTLLDKNNISSNYLLKDASRITTTKTRVIAKNNQILRFDSEDLHPLILEISELLFQKICACIKDENPDVIIFQDYNKGVLSEKLIRDITMACLNRNIPIAVDPKKNNFFSYQLCTLFKPNLRELQEGLQMSIDASSLVSLNAATSALHKKLHHGISLITLSENGVYLRAGKDVIAKPAHVRKVADVSGAGDTVISVAALCLAAKTNLDIIAELSNIAGGIVCEFPGVVSIDKETLLETALKLS